MGMRWWVQNEDYEVEDEDEKKNEKGGRGVSEEGRRTRGSRKLCCFVLFCFVLLFDMNNHALTLTMS